MIKRRKVLASVSWTGEKAEEYFFDKEWEVNKRRIETTI